MRIADSLLLEYDQESTKTRKVLERCPEDKFGWKPHEKFFAMAELAAHLANIASWGVMTIEQDSFDCAPAGGQRCRAAWSCAA
jgi:hypothetical protein